MNNERHLDCRNFAPVDVAKGICHQRKELVLADDAACELFEKMPKCGHCANYVPSEDQYLGICAADDERPMAYPEMVSVTCKWFAWNEQ